MKPNCKSKVSLLAHLYQIRTTFFATFQVFFKSNSALVIGKKQSRKGFKFFLHIDKNNAKLVQVNLKNTCININTLEMYLKSIKNNCIIFQL